MLFIVSKSYLTFRSLNVWHCRMDVIDKFESTRLTELGNHKDLFYKMVAKIRYDIWHVPAFSLNLIFCFSFFFGKPD